MLAAGIAKETHHTPLRAPMLVARSEPWGYAVGRVPNAGAGETLRRSFLRFAGLATVLAAYGQWALPAALFSGDAMVAKAVLSLVLGGIGVLLYWIGSTEAGTEVQVDLLRRELRIAARGNTRRDRARRRIPMSVIASVRMARRSDGSDGVRLVATTRRSKEEIEIGRGAEDEVLPIYHRLSADLRPPQERIARALAEAVPFRSSRA